MADYTIDGSKVYIDDVNVYLSADPHTNSGGWVNVELISKKYEGEIDVVLGVDTEQFYPKKFQRHNPHMAQRTAQKSFLAAYNDPDNWSFDNSYSSEDSENFYNGTLTVYTKLHPDEGNTLPDWVLYGTWTYDRLDKITKIIYWEHYYQVEWDKITKDKVDWQEVYYDYQGMNKWYHARVNVVKNQLYTTRIWMHVIPKLNGEVKKFWLAIKPANETIQEAIANGHLYSIDPWWDTDWSYRKSHTINGSSDGAQTNYQLQFKVYYGSGTDGTETVRDVVAGKVYCGSKCETDFDDIRFTQGEDTLCDQWLEEKTDSSYAIFWVEVPSIPASPSTQTIYIYYGNSGATALSDIDATFIYGNDMDNLTDFDADFTKTTGSDRVLDSSTFSRIVINFPDDSATVSTEYYALPSSLPSNRKFRFRIWMAGAADSGNPYARFHQLNSSDVDQWVAGCRGGGIGSNTIIADGIHTFGTFEQSTLRLWSLILDGSAEDVLNVWIDDNDEYTTDEPWDATGTPYELELKGVGSSWTGDAWFGSIYIGEYTTNEPTHGAWGDEEEPPAAGFAYVQLANAAASFTPASDGVWATIDAYTDYSIPKDAVIEVLLENNQKGSENEMGVRAVGSSLSRIADIHECEPGDNTHMTMLVQLDSDGKFQAYSEDVSDTTHHIVGYFTSCTYIEAFSAWSATANDNSWKTKDLFTDYSVPVNRVCEVMCENPNAGATASVGVRIDGSIIDRRITVHEAEQGGRCGYSAIVKSDADGEINYYDPNVSVDAVYTLLGYFDNTVDFTERQDSLDAAADTTWEDEALLSYGTPAGAVVAILLFNGEAAANNELGVREDGTSINRKWDEHEAEPGSEYTGFRLCVTAGDDANRTIDIYEEDTSENNLYLHGWFAEVAGATTYTVTYLMDSLFKEKDLTQSYLLDMLMKEKDLTLTYLIDLAIQKEYSLSYLLDMIAKKDNVTVTYLLDTLMKKSDLTTTYNIDAVLVQQVLKTYLLDVVTKKGDITITYLLDALLEKEETRTYLIDALVKKLGITTSYLIDVIFDKEYAKTYLIDTLFKENDITITYLLDVLFKDTETRTYLVDTLYKLNNQTITYLLDLYIKKEITETYLIDMLTKQSDITISYLVDMVIVQSYYRTYLLDVIFSKAGVTATYLLDTLLEKEESRTYLIDTLFKENDITLTYLIDVVLESEFSRTYLLDAVFKKEGVTLTYLLDAIFNTAYTREYLLNTLFKKDDVIITYLLDTLIEQNDLTVSYLIDVIFESEFLRSYLLDVLTKKTDITKTYLLNALIQEEDITATYLLDVLLKNTPTRSYLIDALIKKADLSVTYLLDTFIRDTTAVTYLLDTLVKQGDITLTYLIDTMLQSTYTRSYLLDMIMSKSDVTMTYLLDSYFSAAGTVTVQYLLDVLLTKESTTQYLVDTLFKRTDTKTYLVDTVFKKLGLTTSYLLDVMFEQEYSISYLLDTLIEKQDITLTYLIDALIKSKDITQSYNLDTIYVLRNTVEYLLDVLLKGTVAPTYLLDNLYKKLDIVTVYSIDVVFGYKISLPTILITTEGKVLLNTGKKYVFITDHTRVVNPSEMILQKVS